MTLQTALHAAGFELVLRVEGYEFPAIRLRLGRQRAALRDRTRGHAPRTFPRQPRPVIYTVELERFTEQLRALDHDPTGQPTLEHSAEEIGITLHLEAGNRTLEGFLADSTAARLEFENIDIDQAFIRQALNQLEPIPDTPPARGSLHD